ncbi:carboxyltransferase domain-containing protein [Candidatus Pelagibacter sp.]|nr:carboxyltransferase domain-containing protein [Candidatus Pelagibacter sp.]
MYTFESPGGWNIIGKTPVDIFDNKKNTEPNLINPGDTISFYQISKLEYEKKYE